MHLEELRIRIMDNLRHCSRYSRFEPRYKTRTPALACYSPSMAPQDTRPLEIHFYGFDMQSVKDFETLLRSHDDVLAVNRQLVFQDGISTRDLAQTIQQVKLVVEIAVGTAVGKAVGNAILEIAKDRVREWLKNRGQESA